MNPTQKQGHKLLIGPAGCPRSSVEPSTLAGIQRVKELGLDCMEMEFVQGVRMGPATAAKVKETKEKTGIRLTVHAPYFINLNAREPEKLKASIKRILDSARIGSLCGAESVVFHAGYYLGDDPDVVYKKIAHEMEGILKTLEQEKINIRVRPETTGKATQFGSLDELLQLGKDMGIYPCIDLSHLHARENGAWNSIPEFEEILSKVDQALGRQALEEMHLHLSGIAYGPKGEKHHLIFADADLKYRDYLSVLKKNRCSGFLICESPSIEEDALLIQKTYRSLRA